MGRPKAFLPHRLAGVTFLDHLISSARTGGIEIIHVVGRKGDTALRQAAVEAGAGYVENADSERGQLSSVVTGLEHIPDPAVGSILLLPVDIPLVTPAVVAAVLAAARRSSAVIVRATHSGRHGHPVLFKRAVFDELRHADAAIGARAVVRADPSRVLDVEVDDPGVLEDVDTPQDYERVFGRRL